MGQRQIFPLEIVVFLDFIFIYWDMVSTTRGIMFPLQSLPPGSSLGFPWWWDVKPNKPFSPWLVLDYGVSLQQTRTHRGSWTIMEETRHSDWGPGGNSQSGNPHCHSEYCARLYSSTDFQQSDTHAGGTYCACVASSILRNSDVQLFARNIESDWWPIYASSTWTKGWQEWADLRGIFLHFLGWVPWFLFWGYFICTVLSCHHVLSRAQSRQRLPLSLHPGFWWDLES